MARQEILLGSTPDGEGGDNARTAFGRINEMTAELYQQVGATGAAVDTLQAEVSSAAESIGNKVDKVAGKGLSANDFTDALYQKLSGLEGSKFQGLFVSLEALQVAVPAGEPGWYAHIDPGTGGEATAVAIWDDDDAQWIIQAGSGGEMTPAQILAALLANPDVNVLTDDDYALVGTIGGKVDKVAGKGLSTEDYTSAEKARLASAVVGTDQRLSDAREWSAETVSQTEAETGTGTTRRAWSAVRVRQAVAAWWNTVSSVFGRSLVAVADAAAGRTALGLGTAATRAALGSSGALYGRDSILGTVAQSSGVPTGAIIERGSNANGQYIKFADGTLLCTGNFPETVGASANSNFFFSWTFPHAYAAQPFVSGVAQPSVSAEIYGYLYDSSGGSLAQTTLIFRNGATAQSYSVRPLAVGRWF